MIGDRLPGPVERGVAVTRGSEGLLITRPSPACVTRKEEKGAERRSHEVAYHMRKKQMEKKKIKSPEESSSALNRVALPVDTIVVVVSRLAD